MASVGAKISDLSGIEALIRRIVREELAASRRKITACGSQGIATDDLIAYVKKAADGAARGKL